MRSAPGICSLAILDVADEATWRIIGAGPVAERVAREAMERPPGDERV